MALDKCFIHGSISVFYALIGLEIIIMISPFAAYFYGVYGPLLNILYTNPYTNPFTAWLTGFFLPHAAVSKSGFLNLLNSFGRTLFSLGIITFLIGAVQVYSAKFRRKGVVTGLLYRWVRHPQYLFLAVAGLGLLLFWPRFFILLLYVTMLFVYYFLARHEEQRLLKKYGESYHNYMQKTAMFIPGEPGGKIFRLVFGWIKMRWLALTISYGVMLMFSTLVALALRNYTISQTTLVYLPEKQITAISILPGSESRLREVVNNALKDSTLAAEIEKFCMLGHKGFMIHIMPQHYMMQGLFTQPANSDMRSKRRLSWRGVLGFIFPFLSSHGHHNMKGSMDSGPKRLIVSQLTWPNGEYASFDKALAFRVKHLPLLLVDINESDQVMKVQHTAPRNFWGDMPMPVF